MKIASRIKKVPPSGIRKFFDIVSELEGVISLGVGEPDFVTPWHIREACIYALEKGFTMYTSNYGMIELREEISNYLKNRFKVEYNPENEILVTTGVSEALDLAIRATVDTGDVAIIHEPNYVSYKPCVIFAGGEVKIVETKEENRFKLIPEELEKAVSDKTKILIINYPNNPTGAVMRKKELEEIADVVIENDMLVISDEIYAELTYGGKHISLASLNGMRERTILLNGFSKAYAMTGFRIGYACGPSQLVEAMMKIHQYCMLCAPITSQKAAIEALRRGYPEVKKMVEHYNQRRRFIVKRLNEMGLNCIEPRGAFYAFPSIRDLNMSSEEFSTKLLKEERVVVVPGNTFGNSGEGFIRCSYATSFKSIEEAMLRMERFVLKHLK